MDYKRALKDGLSPETIMQEMERRGAKLDYKRALADGVSPDNIMSEMFSRLPPAKSPLIANPNASWLGTNLAKSLETGREVVGGLQRFAGDEQGGLSTIAKSKANMEQLETDVPSMSTKDVTGVGSGLKYIGENVVKNAALAIPSMVGGAVAALAAPVVGGGALAAGGLAALGALVPSVAIETGIISADSHKVDGNRGRILKGALPAGALDAVSTAVTLGAGGLLKKPLQKTAVDLLKNETGKQIAVRYAKGAAGLVGAGLEEGATEGAQSPLEKWGAGKQVFKDGKTYEMDLLGNTVAALSGGYLGSKDNYTPEMQDEIKESAWGGAAAGFGMAGGGKAISVGKEKINEFMKRREERIFLEELENGSLSSSENAAPEMTRNTEIGIIAVEEAKQKKAEDDAKEADQMHQENMQQLAAQVPVIKTMTENPDTPVTSEHRAIVEQVAQGMPGTKEGDAAAKLLSKIDKSMEKDSEANHSELHKQLDDMKYDAKHGLLGDEHLSTVLGIYKNNQDGKARDKAKIIIDTHLQAEEKRNKEIEKKREELKGNAVDAISNVRSELKSDAHNQAAMVAMDSKIATAKAALDAVETSGTKEKPFTPQQRQAAEGKKSTLKAKLEALKKEKMLLSQEHAQSSNETDIAHAEARQALVEAQGHTAENVGQSVEHAKSHIEQLVSAGKAAWKNFKEFSSYIEGIYGKYIKPHLFALWQHAKNALKVAGNKIIEAHQEKKNELQKPARKGLFGALFSNKGQVNMEGYAHKEATVAPAENNLETEEDIAPIPTDEDYNLAEDLSNKVTELTGKPHTEATDEEVAQAARSLKEFTVEGNEVIDVPGSPVSFGTGLAQVSKDGVIQINIDKARDTFENPKNQEQIDVLNSRRPGIAKKYEKLGFTAKQFMSVFKNFDEFRQYLIRHEQSHINNKDNNDPVRSNIWKEITAKYDMAKEYDKAVSELKAHPRSVDIEVRATLEGLTEQQRQALKEMAAVQETQASTKNEKMSYAMSPKQNIYGENTTTLALSEDGRRTGSTRSFKMGNGVGSVMTFEGRPTQYKVIGYEQITPEKAANPEWVRAWSKKEGWTPEHFYTQYNKSSTVRDGAWQTSWTKIGQTNTEQPSQATKTETPIATPQNKIDNINKILDSYNWPKELRDAITVVHSTKSTLPLFTDMSAKSHLAKFGITGMAVNWILKNQAKVKLGSIKSEQQVRELAEKQLAEKQDKSKYPSLKETKAIKKNFDEWTEALKQYDTYFADMMFDYTIKLIEDDRREDVGVPKVNKAILAEVYDFAVNNPGQTGYSKEYERRIIAAAIEASSHEKSASGKGVWIHIPHSPAVDFVDGNGHPTLDRNTGDWVKAPDNDQRKANIKLLECLSPTGWCTAEEGRAGYNAPNSVGNYDNYILVDSNKIRVVTGLQVRPDKELYDATSIANNEIASIDWLDDTIAFMDKHDIDYVDEPTIRRAIEYKKRGKTDADTAHLRRGYDDENNYNDYEDIDDERGAYDWTAYDNQWDDDFELAFTGDIPFSKRTTGNIEGWATGDSAVVNAAVVDPKDAGKVALHEVAHLGMIRLAQDLGGMKELHKILKSAKTELMKAVPELLKRTGHTSLAEFAIDYGYDANTEAGEAKILVELTARWAEKFESVPHASWWTKLINSITMWYKKYAGKELTKKEVDVLVAEMIRYGATDNKAERNNQIVKSEFNSNDEISKTAKLINAFDKWYEEKPSSEYRLADASVDSATNKLVFTRWISAIVTEIVDPNESLTATAISTKWRPIDWLANPGNMSYFGEHQVVPRLNALLPGFSEWVKGFKPLDNSWVDGLLDTVGKDEEYNKAQKDKQSATLAVITALETVRRRIPELSESDMPILMTDALYNILAKKLGISQENKEPEQPQKEKTQEREYTPDNITSLAPNEVFVFGANTVGGHGGGAAGLAQFGDTKSNYDAPPIGTKGKWSEYGVVDRLMEGTEGKSFGLVTKSAAIVKGKLYIHGKRSVDFARISKSLDALVKVANEHPELKFLVTEFGTRMAGFTAEEMKSILASKVLPDNVILPKSFETRPDVIVVEDAKEAVKESVVKDEKDYSAPIASEFVNHSGGAKGSDAFWDRTGKVFGVTDHRHYREESAEKLGDKFLNDEGVEPVRIKEDSTEWEVATRKAMLATLALRPTTRIDDKTKRMVIIEGESAFAPEDLQIRNWFQVKNAEAVFAIGRIVEPADMSSFAAYSKAGDKQRSTKANKKGERYINNSGKQIVDGGTGYAVEMAIQKGDIPVYVFDQTRGSWFKWDALKNEFTKTDTPTLTKNFAGIGTRELTPEGMKAIRDVYAKTFSTENNRRADRLIEDVSTEMANSEERIKEIERKKEEAKKEAEGLAPLEAFFVYVGKGVYQEWFNNRVAWIGMIEAEKERQSILQQHVDSIKKDFPRYKIVGLKQDGLDTVEIEQDSPLYEYPGFERLMVGAHGVYAEFGEASRPFIAKESITNPVKQSDSRQYITYYSNGSRVYDQRKMVNYAQYEIGKLYVSADVVEGLSTRNEVAAPIIAKAHAERSGINSWNEQGVTSISRETIQQLNDVYELFSDLSKKEMIDWLKNQLENRLDIELNGVAEKVLMTDENGNSLVVSKTIKPARTTSPTGSMGLRRFDSESEEQHRTVVAYNSATALGKPTNNFVFSTKNGSSTVAMVAPGDGELEIWSYVEGFFEDTYTTKIASKSPSAARELKATATSVDKDPYKYIGSTDSIAAFAYKASYPNGVGLSKEERDAHRFETTRKIQEGLERKNEELLKSIEKDINSNPVLNGSSPESIITYTSPSDPDERRAYFTNNKVSTIVVGLLRDVMNRGYDLKSFYKSMFYEEASKSFASTKEIPVMLVAFHSYINRDRASNAEYDGPYNEQNDAHKTISQEAEHLVSVAPAEEHTKRQGLNKEQQEAVDYSGGPQLIVAGAGTGKTTVITERIKSLVNKGIPPEEILAITFARDARKEMKDRLEGTNAESANVSTFHAFGKGILDEYYKEFGYRSKPAVLSELQSTQIVESIMKELGIADMTPDEALAAIDKLKNDGVTPGKYAKQKDKSASISNIYTEYAEKTKNSIDLNDMILGMKQHLLNNPAILNDVQNSIRSMLVDEYQDTNKAQYELMSLLAPHDLTVVGDDNQSLYSWRGADVGALKNFMSDFNPKVTQLVENYRTTGTILEAAQDVISKNEDRISTNLTPSREEGNPIIYREVANEKDEAFFIAKEIKDAISRGAAPGSIAILTRTNAQHAIINRELASRKIFGIHVQTFNGAKGREFSTVFIAGVSEGLTPHVKAGDTLEEERRLLYVGMTRAKDNLIMTHANETSQGGKTAEKEPSRFLADIKPGRWDEKSTQMVDVKKEKFSDLTAEEWEYGYAEDIKAADRHEAFQGASRKMTDADRVDTFESEFGVQRAQHEFDSGHDGNLVRDQYKRDNKEVAGFYEYYDGAKEKRKQKEAAFNVRQLQSLQEMVAFNRTSAEFIAPLFDALDVLIDQVPTNKKHTDLSPAEKKERKKLTSSRLKDALKIVVDKSEDLVALKEAYSAAIESGKIDAIVANFMRALTHFNGKQVLAHQGILNQNYQGLENESIPFMQFGTAEFSEALKELTPLGEQISANPVLYTGLDLDETYRDTVQLVNIQKAAADPLEIAQGFAPDLDSELQAWKRPASMQDIHNSVVESVGNNVSPSLRQAIRVYRTRSAAIAIYDERLANVDGLMKLLSFLSSAEIDKAKYENKIANPEFKTYATEEQRTAWMASMKEGLAYINDTIDKIKAKIPKGTSLESLRKTKDRIQRDTVAMQSLARPVLMRIAFEQSHVMDASLFTKIAGDFNKVHPDSKLTAADVFNKYLAVGADIVRLHSEMNRLSRDFWDKQIAKAYGIGKVSRQVKAREVLLARLTTEEKDLLAQMGSHKGDAVDVLKNLSAPVRNKMIAIFNAEIALKNIDVKASMRELDKDKKASMENVKKQEAEPSIQQKIDALNNQIIELKKQEQGLWDIVSRRAYVGKGINRYKAEWKTNSAYIMMSRLFSPSELSVFYPGVEPQDYLDNSANRISRSVDSPILGESNIRGKKPLQKVTNIEIHNPSSQKTILAKHLTIRPSLQQQQEIQQAEQRLLELRKMQSALEQDITNLENADIADVLGSVTTPQQIRSLEDVAQEKAPEHYTQEEADVVSRYKGANLKAVSLKGVAKFFFEKIANIFGANLVTVKGDSDWHGKYIPNRGKGKPTIVINVNAPSLTAVFAHEMFHHILNKISPAAYDAFREAMRGAVNENKWEEAVIRIARQMDSSYVKTVLDDVILTDSINTSPLYGSNFNDDPLVRKKKASFWKPKEPPIAKDKKFAAFQRHDKLNVSDEIREEIENELYSEIFSQAIHKGAFWSTLGKTLEGRGVVAYCVSHMANRSASILSLLKQISPETQNSYLVSQLVKNWSDPASFNTDAKEGRSIHDILVGVIDNSLFVDKKGNVTAKTIVNGMELGLRDDVTRDRKINLLNEAKLLSGEIKKKTNVLAKEARKIIPQGTNGYVQVMDAIENWINRILDWLAAHKPAGMFADFRTREEIVALAQKVLHGGNAASSITYYKILKKHKEAFSGMTDDELMDLHDKASRYAKDVTALDSLKPEQKAAFLDMLAESEKLYDEIAAEGILPPRFTEDGKPNPLAQYRNMHMGQTIKWRHKDGRVIDESISKILKPDKSQLKRDEGFLETKSDVSTKELHEKYDYEKINPLEMFRQYVEDVHHMIAVSKMIKEGREKGLIKRFESRQKAAYNKNNDGTANPYVSINDDTARILKEIPGGDITEIQMFTEIYAVRYVTNKNKKKGKWLTDKKAMLQFDTQEEAAEALAKLSPTAEIKYVSKDVMKPVPTHLADDLYFDKDLAHLLDTILSRDNFRQGQLFGVSGEKIMDIKNTLTMLELSMSAFHWATISAETVSSYGEYKMQLARLNGKSMVAASLNSVNVMEAFNSSRELQELTEKIIVDNNYKNTEEGKALLERLLGASDVDIVDAYMRFFDNGGAMDHQDIGLRSGVSAWGDTEKSFAENVELMQANYPNSALAPIGKVAIHQLFVKSSALLMEKMIPRVKFAAFIREYIIKLMQFEKNNGRKATEAEKSEIARHVMKFVEDRFGEVNWKNQWLNKTYKTTLQFLFRSFTWVAGSWKALGKAGIDYAKLGWFTVKDMGQAEGHKRQYQLTEHGLWGMSAMIAHVASVAAVYSLYFASSALCGGGQDDDEDTPWITKLLFPRIDPYDNTKRLTIPSYVSEGYKILSHFGMFGSKVELEKLVTGRMNSMIGKSVELIKGEDFRGVQIINPDDNMLEKSWSMTKHVLATGVPMSLTGMKKIYNEEGMSSRMLFNLAGMQDAPASAKRSVAANAAFDLSRREYKGKEITEDEMEMKSVLKRAMQEYVKGDKTSVDALLASGEVSKRQYDIALTRYPVLNNAPNPLYKDPLSQAIQRLTVKSSLKVYSLMKESEKAKHTAEIQKKINNMKLRKDTPKVLQDRYIEEWNAIKG